MKISVKITILIILMMTLTSCLTKIENISERVYKGSDSYVYNDVLYIYYNFNIYKYDLDLYKKDSIISPLPLRSDVLCKHNNEECPLYTNNPVARIIIDEYETTLNNNSPILYITDTCSIKKYNTSTNAVKMIKKDMDGTITSFWVYEDRLYYTAYYGNEYELGYVTKDGKDSVILKRENKDVICRIIGFYNGYLYYGDDMLNIYYADLNLTSEKLLLRTNCYTTGIIYEGKLYYGDNQINTQYENTIFESCTLYRYDLNNISDVNIEKIEENILVAPIPMIFQANELLLYNKCTPVITGTETFYDIEGNKVDYDIFDSGSKKMYFYNMSIEDTGILFEDMGCNLSRFYYADKNMILLEYSNYNTEDVNASKIRGGFMLYDYINNNKFELVMPIE